MLLLFLILAGIFVLGGGTLWTYLQDERCKYWHKGFTASLYGDPNGCPIDKIFDNHEQDVTM